MKPLLVMYAMLGIGYGLAVWEDRPRSASLGWALSVSAWSVVFWPIHLMHDIGRALALFLSSSRRHPSGAPR